MIALEELNFHHLRYFWLVAREGSVTAAAEQLGVGQPVVSAQLKRLERQFRQKLFEKSGRKLKLTEFGRMVFEYAEDIFRLGRELCHSAENNTARLRPTRFTVGIEDVLPKLIVYKLLEPVYDLPDEMQLVCVEDRPEKLLAELVLGNLDLVLTDAPEAEVNRVKVFRHLLGECGVTFFAAASIAKKLSAQFPDCLHAIPMLLPLPNSSLRRSLDAWFAQNRIQPNIRGEFADTALLKVFGQAGRGVFVLPSAIEADVMSQFDVNVIGRVSTIRERYYAMTAERKLTHPAIMRIQSTAQKELFSE